MLARRNTVANYLTVALKKAGIMIKVDTKVDEHEN